MGIKGFKLYQNLVETKREMAWAHLRICESIDDIPNVARQRLAGGCALNYVLALSIKNLESDKGVETHSESNTHTLHQVRVTIELVH